MRDNVARVVGRTEMTPQYSGTCLEKYSVPILVTISSTTPSNITPSNIARNGGIKAFRDQGQHTILGSARISADALDGALHVHGIEEMYVLPCSKGP